MHHAREDTGADPKDQAVDKAHSDLMHVRKYKEIF